MIYKTISGDTFDLIAFKQYGDEKLVGKIIDANIQHADIIIFPANVELKIPDIVVTPTSTLPPWKRGGV